MNADKLIGAEASLALVGVVAGDLIGTPAQERTLPRPRRIVAVLAFYSLLSLMAALGSGPARLASAMGGVAALTSLVLGATGRTIVDLIDRFTGLLTSPGAGSSPSAGAGFGSPSNPNPAGSPGDAPPGYHWTRGPNGWALIPNNPNRGGAVTPAAGRVRSPQPAGGFV